MAGGTGKPPRWSSRASAALDSSLARIAAEDPSTAEAVLSRVERSVALICAQPGLGTLTAARGVRRHPIPGTGHIINYRVVRGDPYPSLLSRPAGQLKVNGRVLPCPTRSGAS